MAILKIYNLTKSFGGLKALKDVSMELRQGEIFSLIGPNGAGKTTLFNVITNLIAYETGGIFFSSNSKEINLNKIPLYKMTEIGISRTFQNIRLFSDLSVIDNVKIGLHSKTRSGFISTIFNSKSKRTEEMNITAKAIEYLKFVGIAKYAYEIADNLSYGDQRRLEIARALASEPKLLLLDEPAAGMNITESKLLMNSIRQIKEKGITVFLIEHDMKVVMEISDEIYVLDYGEVIAKGTPDEIRNNKKVIEAYLGKDYANA